MGRPAKLTLDQWAEIEKRILAGEKPAALAKVYGIHRAGISRKCAIHLLKVKSVANQIIETETALRSLPVSQQLQVISLVDEIKMMSAHLASAGSDTALVSKMFARAAKDATNKIMFKAMDDDGVSINPERLAECQEEILAVMKSTTVANESSKISLNLLNANREAVVQINQVEQKKDKILTRDEFYGRNPAKRLPA